MSGGFRIVSDTLVTLSWPTRRVTWPFWLPFILSCSPHTIAPNWRTWKRTSTKLSWRGQEVILILQKWLTFGGDPICVWIPDHFFIFFTNTEWGIFGHLSAFLNAHTINGRFVL